MPKTHEQLWVDCQLFIKDNIGDDQYNNWFRDIVSLGFENNVLRLFVPTDTFVEYIESKYLRVLGAGIRKVYGESVQLRWAYNVKKSDPESKVELAVSHTSTEVMRETTDAVIGAKPRYPGAINSQLNPCYTLENYCVSDCNRVAINIARAIADDPRIRTFNPFFVYGPTGTGKTHLMQGVGIRIKENNPMSRALYVPARLFESQFTTASTNGTLNQFFNFYQSIDVLIVDDVQELQGKERTQNTFFNIFNYLHLNNKLILFSSDRAPAEMDGFQERLLGRFRSGSSIELFKPDLNLRRQVLRQKAEQDGLQISDEILEYIAQNITDNIRELQGVLASLLAYATALDKPITLDLAKSIVSNAVRVRQRILNFDIIAEKVSSFYGLEPDTLFTKSRKREISDARQMAMYIAKKHTDMPLTAIGRNIGRSHATVIYSIRNIEERMGFDRQLQDDISQIESALFA